MYEFRRDDLWELSWSGGYSRSDGGAQDIGFLNYGTYVRAEPSCWMRLGTVVGLLIKTSVKAGNYQKIIISKHFILT